MSNEAPYGDEEAMQRVAKSTYVGEILMDLSSLCLVPAGFNWLGDLGQ